MKVLRHSVDFVRANNINTQVGEHFLIKQSIATGWARLAKVTRIMKTQVELEVINVVPTEETNRFGVRNGLKERHEGFFATWAFSKKSSIGKRLKFSKTDGIMVGCKNDWNPSILCELIK